MDEYWIYTREAFSKFKIYIHVNNKDANEKDKNMI